MDHIENYDDWLTGFGNRIRLERERQNLTRISLAEMAHTEQGYIVQIERGSRSPSMKTFTNILSALGVSADYLIFGSDDAGQNEKEIALNDFNNLLKRGDAEDIKALYQLAAHMLRHKNQQDLYEFSDEFDFDSHIQNRVQKC
jgi:transcriptional regulator with XRE-family HTH domain